MRRNALCRSPGGRSLEGDLPLYGFLLSLKADHQQASLGVLLRGYGSDRGLDTSSLVASRYVNEEGVGVSGHRLRRSRQLLRRRIPAQFDNRMRPGDVPRVAYQLRAVQPGVDRQYSRIVGADLDLQAVLEGPEQFLVPEVESDILPAALQPQFFRELQRPGGRCASPVGQSYNVIHSCRGIHLEIENFRIVVDVVVGLRQFERVPPHVRTAAVEIDGQDRQGRHGLFQQLHPVRR